MILGFGWFWYVGRLRVETLFLRRFANPNSAQLPLDLLASRYTIALQICLSVSTLDIFASVRLLLG